MYHGWLGVDRGRIRDCNMAWHRTVQSLFGVIGLAMLSMIGCILGRDKKKSWVCRWRRNSAPSATADPYPMVLQARDTAPALYSQ